jgi:ATP dependent DNA ligase domain
VWPHSFQPLTARVSIPNSSRSCPRFRAPCRRASLRRAFPRKPPRLPGRTGCTKSSMTASGSLPARIASVCGSTAVRGMTSPSVFPLIVDGLAALRTRSCIIDGEAVACGEDGIASFDRIRYRRHDASVFLYAFDLIELDGEDLRREPLGVRKATLASVLARAAAGLRFNEHLQGEDGPLVFRHACKLGLRGYRVEAKGLTI